MDKCTYCGVDVKNPDRDHVVPKCLYKESDVSRHPLVTVPACRSCNGGFSDDETHFRNVLLGAGQMNDTVQKLWSGPVARSFKRGDAERRKADLRQIMRQVETPDGPRYAIYPAESPRVLRVVKKVVRGLSRHHGLSWPVSEESVLADVLRYELPPAFERDVDKHSVVPEVLNYGYDDMSDPPDGSMAWVLTFFERTRFIVSMPA